MNIEDRYRQWVTEDFQNRRDNYPRSGIPDVIEVYDETRMLNRIVMILWFKNTPIENAVRWTKEFARRNSLPFTKVEGWQEGDYQDDWVMVEMYKEITS